MHTQSTRLSSSGFGGGANAGAGGGLDDRFDFIMMSENFNTSSRFSYVNGTYSAYGNNANCLNKSVNDATCTGTYSLTMRNNLYNMSDHLPVVVQFQINEPLATTSFKKDKAFMWFESSNITDVEVIIGVDTSHFNTQNNKLYIYNTLGQLVKTVSVDNQSSIAVSTENLHAGMYFIKANGSSTVLKFIKK